MLVKCDMQGWHVIAEWYGAIRVIFRPANGPGLEILDIRDCIEFANDPDIRPLERSVNL